MQDGRALSSEKQFHYYKGFKKWYPFWVSTLHAGWASPLLREAVSLLQRLKKWYPFWVSTLHADGEDPLLREAVSLLPRLSKMVSFLSSTLHTEEENPLLQTPKPSIPPFFLDQCLIAYVTLSLKCLAMGLHMCVLVCVSWASVQSSWRRLLNYNIYQEEITTATASGNKTKNTIGFYLSITHERKQELNHADLGL